MLENAPGCGGQRELLTGRTRSTRGSARKTLPDLLRKGIERLYARCDRGEGAAGGRTSAPACRVGARHFPTRGHDSCGNTRPVRMGPALPAGWKCLARASRVARPPRDVLRRREERARHFRVSLADSAWHDPRVPDRMSVPVRWEMPRPYGNAAMCHCRYGMTMPTRWAFVASPNLRTPKVLRTIARACLPLATPGGLRDESDRDESRLPFGGCTPRVAAKRRGKPGCDT